MTSVNILWRPALNTNTILSSSPNNERGATSILDVCLRCQIISSLSLNGVARAQISRRTLGERRATLTAKFAAARANSVNGYDLHPFPNTLQVLISSPWQEGNFC